MFLIISMLFVGIASAAVSDSLYASFQRYTNFSAAAYASSGCPIPPYGASVVEYFANDTTDTHATLFQDSAAEEFIIAYKGTSDFTTLIDDISQALGPFDTVGVDCSDCEVQASYLNLWNSISTTVISTLDTQMAANPAYKLTVTGHSLGAGLAAFASASFYGLGMNFTTYTFGEPRVGNPAFADYIDSIRPTGTMYRVTHANDGVPQANPTDLGYRHHSTEYWQEDATTEDADDTVECVGQESPDCNNSELGVGIGPEGLGINAAHLWYSNIVIGNPLDGGATACSG